MSDAITLPARMDMPAAIQLVNDLRQAEGNVQIDASGVLHLGALALQALVSASRHANEHGHHLEICNSSDRMVEQIELMGATLEDLMEGKI